MVIVSWFLFSADTIHCLSCDSLVENPEAAERRADSVLKAVVSSTVNTELTHWRWLKDTTNCVRH